MFRPRLTVVCTFVTFIAAALTLLPLPAQAQTVVNPTRAEFTASADHDATAENGTPIVASYEIQFFLLGGALPFQAASLGKPSPDASNTITVDLASAFLGWPLPGVAYVAAVAAVGPGGTAVSGLSNPFQFSPPPPPCSYSLSVTSQNVVTAGGTGSTDVTTADGCTWTVVSNASWITVSGSGSRTGSGRVDYTVAANTGAARIGTLTVAGQNLTVSQDQFCGFSLSSTSQSISAAGETGSTTVTTASGCAWTVTSNNSWITFSGASSRTSSGTVNYTVAANTGGARTGTLTVAGQNLTVSQDQSCSFSLSSTSQSMSDAGGTGSTTVTTASGCAWTVTSNNGWITFSGASSRTSSGTVNYTVAANSGVARTGTLTIAGATFTVSQSAPPCDFSLSSTSQNISADGGTGSATVTTTSGCQWTVTSNNSWIVVSGSSSRTGSGAVDFTVAANPGTTQRTGSISIAGTSFSVIEAAGAAIPAPPSNVRITSGQQ